MTTATAVRERPILFSGRLVRGILEDRKSVTRRVVMNVPPRTTRWLYNLESDGLYWPATSGDYTGTGIRCPYGKPGDQLWVRETWRLISTGGWPDSWYGIHYRADDSTLDRSPRARVDLNLARRDWRPSIHMPRWASRIQLEVTEVRVERLQEITEDDAVAEGVERTGGGRYWLGAPHRVKGVAKVHPNARRAFADLWDSLNAKRGYGWEANPWVWVVRFRRIEG